MTGLFLDVRRVQAGAIFQCLFSPAGNFPLHQLKCERYALDAGEMDFSLHRRMLCHQRLLIGLVAVQSSVHLPAVLHKVLHYLPLVHQLSILAVLAADVVEFLLLLFLHWAAAAWLPLSLVLFVFAEASSIELGL